MSESLARRPFKVYQETEQSIATGGLLLGVSRAAITVSLRGGGIIFDTVDEIVIDGQPCLVYQPVVEGRVEVTNTHHFEITFSEVGVVPLRFRAGGAEAGSENVTRTDVLTGNLEVSDFHSAIVAGNRLEDGNLKVNNNLGAVVARCAGNLEVDAFGNRVTGEGTPE